MSTIRDPATITSVGRRMMTAGGDITYTKAVLYGQDISHLTREQLESLTSIGNPLVTVPLGISDKNDNGNGTTVILEATFQNNNLKADMPYTAVGFFAKRGDDAEKLIAVGVATEGAYLAATSPDGVATDALDIKVAIAIGDSANVTAMIDPAGSVTPAALHNAITDVKSEMKTGLDTKADKSTVDSDVKSINDTLATKADKQTVTDDLVKKADKTDVDAQIGTVNKSVSDLSDTVKANKDDTDKVLATKADKATVESELSTKANQSDLDKTNAEVAKKASTTDVNSQLATKADAKDVTDALALKDDTVDVDKKIKVVTDLTNTKANTVDVDSKIKTVTDLANTKANSADVYTKTETDNQINKFDLSKVKFRKQFLNGDGDKVDKTWSATKNDDGTYTIDLYNDDWTASKLADVLAQLPNKVDTSTVNAQIADTKNAIKSNTDKLQSAINTKANASDVYTKKQVDDAFSSRDATIATKADKATVDAEIAKIDFTPYAKSADVANELQNYTTTVDLNKLLAGKEDAGTSYSKAELDKKLLTLSTDTDGKVNADQVSSMIANKVDKSDLASDLKSINDSIATKANTTDVNTALAKKDDTTDVDAKIKTVIDLANTKADASDIYTKKQVDDAFSSRDATIATKADKTYVDNQIASIDFGKIKFRKQFLNGDGDKVDKTWSATKNDDGTYTIDLYNDDWTASKLADVLAQLPNKADTSTVNAQITDVKDTAKSNLDKAKSDLNDAINAKANSSDLTALDKKAVKSVGIYPNKLHFESGSFNYWSSEVKASPDANGYALIDLTDDTSAQAAVNQLNAMLTGLNHLQGKQTKDSADANALSETGVYYCSSPAKNFPVGQWGTLVTSNGNGERASQLYFPDDNSAVWFRTLNGDWQGWVRLANIGDVNNAESSLTSSINAVNNKVNVTVPLFRRITAGNTWNDILGASNDYTPVLVSIRDEGGANTLGNFSAAVAFGGGNTKGVLNVAYSDHTARIIGGNGNAPVWHEDIAWKSDVTNLQNQVNTKASASDVNSLNQTISALQQTVQSLQNTVNQQATQITGLQTQVNNQANEIKQLQETTIKGKTFSKSQEAAAEAWEKQNSQQIAFILDN